MTSIVRSVDSLVNDQYCEECRFINKYLFSVIQLTSTLALCVRWWILMCLSRITKLSCVLDVLTFVNQAQEEFEDTNE